MQILSEKLVAHRGFSCEFPENSRASILAALQSGASYIEFDVQLSKNLVPYVIHDSELKRTSGKDGIIYELSSTELDAYRVAYAARFGEKFCHEPLPSLANIVDLLRQWPQCQVFVEIKQASIQQFDIPSVYASVYEILAPIQPQAIIISFDFAFVQYAKQHANTKIGWVFDTWHDAIREQVILLQPEYIFTDWECVPAEIDTLWQGTWQWVIYEIDDSQLAQSWLKKGADLIETNDIRKLLNA